MFVFPISEVISSTGCWGAGPQSFTLNRGATVHISSPANLEGYDRGVCCKQKLATSLDEQTPSGRSGKRKVFN